MNDLIEQTISCPYCGEQIGVLIDPSVEQQDYIEDCQVCCRPIVFQVTVLLSGEWNVQVRRDDE